MSFKNPAQIMECLSDGQGIGVLVPKPRGGHSPWLDVGVAVTFDDDQDHPAAKALQGIDQKAREARCSLANALGPSFLSHLKTKIG